LVAGQVEPPLVDRERLVSFQLELGALILLKRLIEQRLAVREVLQMQLLEPWYFSLILIEFWRFA
jgi:hypothetical protein